MNKCTCGREIKGQLVACKQCYSNTDALYRIAHNLGRIEEHLEKLATKGITANIPR